MTKLGTRVRSGGDETIAIQRRSWNPRSESESDKGASKGLEQVSTYTKHLAILGSTSCRTEGIRYRCVLKGLFVTIYHYVELGALR